MAKHRRHPVGVGLFERKNGAYFTKHPPAQSGTVAPTDKKTQKLHASIPQGSKNKKYHGQQAK